MFGGKKPRTQTQCADVKSPRAGQHITYKVGDIINQPIFAPTTEDHLGVFIAAAVALAMLVLFGLKKLCSKKKEDGLQEKLLEAGAASKPGILKSCRAVGKSPKSAKSDIYQDLVCFRCLNNVRGEMLICHNRGQAMPEPYGRDNFTALCPVHYSKVGCSASYMSVADASCRKENPSSPKAQAKKKAQGNAANKILEGKAAGA